MKDRLKSKFPHYHMCNGCAFDMGGVPTEGNHTVRKGICEYCEIGNQILTPWVDYNWPKEKEVNAIANYYRD